MKRIQLFEFEDFPWLPKPIRAGITNLIVVFHRVTGTREVIAGLVGQARSRLGFNRIVDMGSGSGGAMPGVVAMLNEQTDTTPLQLLLTDLHPSPAVIREINDRQLPHLQYREEPLDATELNQAPEGLKTMVNSFHHIPPAQAQAILRSAQENREPLLIYEMAENNIPTLLWWLLLPLSLTIVFLMALFLTPSVRPLGWKQLVLTYLIPVIPLIYAWDGQASLVRMYTFDDLRQMLSELPQDGYHWEMGKAPRANGKTLGYYLLGYPA
ncbi:MAG: hypothetical protein KDC54_23120 [Lewinella sp.]|nr:hypothetical protein [Lewinella sp.]